MIKKPTAQELQDLGIETGPLTIEEISLEGEGHDRAFRTADGRRFRVRVRLQDQRSVRPGHVAAVPTEFTLAISVAELDDGNAVRKVGEAFLIHDVHELLITREALANPTFDLDGLLLRTIEAEIARAAKAGAGRAAAAESLAAWGINLLPDAPAQSEDEEK